jgi:hypothetical protein
MKAIPIALLAAAMAAAVACSSSSTSPSASVAGTYVLSTVNGEPLPAIITKGNDTAVVVTDTLALTSSQYTRHVVDSVRSEGVPAALFSHTSSGTYTHSGTSITFTDAATDSSVTGSISNSVITISGVENGFSVTGVFNKQ